MGYENILYEVKEGIATITINRPPYNVLDIKTMREMNQALEEVKGRQKELKLLVITQAGDKAFSTGVDVRDHTADKMDEMIEVFHQIFRIMATLDLPSLAVVNGHALGGGVRSPSSVIWSSLLRNRNSVSRRSSSLCIRPWWLPGCTGSSA